MKKDHAQFIDRVVWSVLGSGAAALSRFVFPINDTTHVHATEISRLTQTIEYHERELRVLHKRDAVIYRIESELGIHEKRLNRLERRRRL